jgi:two-component system KDP operon response regulator KdpE
MKHKILIIDDEPQIKRMLRIALEAYDYEVAEAADARTGRISVAMENPALIILDLGLPDQDGMLLLRELRTWYKAPIIVLSARFDENQKVEALDAGADDYITKPFGNKELLARIRNALRHVQPQGNQTHSIFVNGHLKVDMEKRLIWNNEREIQLTSTEYQLLLLFVKHAGKVLTHHFILREIWGAAYTAESQYLRVYMAQLRRKLEADPADIPTLFITETGVGYRMAVL